MVVTADHECGGAKADEDTDYDLIARQTASNEWMWGLVRAGKMSIDDTLATYAGIELTAVEGT